MSVYYIVVAMEPSKYNDKRIAFVTETTIPNWLQYRFGARAKHRDLRLSGTRMDWEILNKDGTWKEAPRKLAELLASYEFRLILKKS